eukprot:GFYU01008970.1.p1 GENE.GFYU01008970.1~~GFYU01008970.1.p1  ORF type:complete len:539 (-),score=148.75 GFYU01008970.1:669-2081(-)
MSYIMLLNPRILAVTGMPSDDAVVSTAICSGTASLIAGVFGNLPFGLAPGLGLSAYFTYGIVGNGGTYQLALTTVFIAGIATLLLSVFNGTNAIMRIIPDAIKEATVVGMGLLLCFIGFKDVKFVVADEGSLLKLGDISDIKLWMMFIGLAIVCVLTYHQVKGGILLAILIVTLIMWISELSPWPESVAAAPVITETVAAFDFGGLDGSAVWPILSFVLVGVFDVSGVMYGMGKVANLMNSKDEVVGGYWGFIGAAVGTTLAGLTGCSPIIVHVESAAGLKEGGKTGLTAVTIAVLFFLSVFLAPVFGEIPPYATTPVLIFIGAMMIRGTLNIDWDQMEYAIPAFITIVIMPFTVSIPNGIMFGVGFYFILYIFTGKFIHDLPASVRGKLANRRVLRTSSADIQGNQYAPLGDDGGPVVGPFDAIHQGSPISFTEGRLSRGNSRAGSEFERTPSLIIPKGELEKIDNMHL